MAGSGTVSRFQPVTGQRAPASSSRFRPVPALAAMLEIGQREMVSLPALFRLT